MKILILDNYDSFTYNLVHMVRSLGHRVDVFRNDKISLDEVRLYDKVMLSPGPGIPQEAGVMKQLIKDYGQSKSILGVCLGHQGIAEVYGATLYNLPTVRHGVTCELNVTAPGERLFHDLPTRITVTQYHSWAVQPESIHDDLEVTAVNDDGLVMAITHRKWDVRGVQFHPESVMTQHGMKMIENWLDI